MHIEGVDWCDVKGAWQGHGIYCYAWGSEHLHVVEVDSLGVRLWPDDAGALRGVHQVPESDGSVRATAQHHWAVVDDASGESPHCLLLTRLREREGRGGGGGGGEGDRKERREEEEKGEMGEVNMKCHVLLSQLQGSKGHKMKAGVLTLLVVSPKAGAGLAQSICRRVAVSMSQIEISLL